MIALLALHYLAEQIISAAVNNWCQCRLADINDRCRIHNGHPFSPYTQT